MKLLAWPERAVTRQLLACLGAQDVARLARVNKKCRRAIARELRRFREGSARVALALWCANHVELEFQSYYQELETHSIPRSSVNDPRVPPRVVSLWEERGKVPGGVVILRPELLPKRTERGFVFRFIATDSQKPMLTSVVQRQRRIYTIVTLQIVKGKAAQGGEPIVLRRMWYLKEFGEWQAMMPSVEKRFFDDSGSLCRYDLVSHDGSVVLELDVPAGVDSMMDYYLVKKAAALVPLHELWHGIAAGIRPTLALSLPSETSTLCTVELCFTALNGDALLKVRLASTITVAQEAGTGSTTASENEGSDDRSTSGVTRRRTGLEHFDIVTIVPSGDVSTRTIPLPSKPGYVWISIEGPEQSTTSRNPQQPPTYYSMAMLHSGARRRRGFQRIDCQWVPGILESFPTPHSRHRRVLKGFFDIAVDDESHVLSELKIVAQHLSEARLRPYAATIASYTRPT